MPTGIRRAIELYWQDRRDSPRIVLTPFEWNQNQGNIGGRVQDRGHFLEFNSLIFAITSENLFAAAIAHELSHVLFNALSQRQHVRMTSREDKIATELLAFELTRRIGFAQDEFFEWINCEVSTKGPYLRQGRGEDVGNPDDLWSRWSKLEEQWASDRDSHPRMLDDAKAEFYKEHSRYFEIALESQADLAWKDIAEVRLLLNCDNEQSVE